MNLCLVGFMGSGKTSTAVELKQFFEEHKIFFIDNEIEKQTEASIKDIFKIYGEQYFRAIEHNILNEVVLNNKNLIIDLGGGGFIQENNRVLLKKENITTIFLNPSFEMICNNLENQHYNRPLLSDSCWKSKAKKLFDERYSIYKTADITIDINKNQNQIDVAKIIKGIRIT